MRFSKAVFIFLLVVGACSSNHKHDPKNREEAVKIQKTESAQKVATDMFSAIDKRDWKAFEQTFANRTVLYLEEPRILKPNEMAAQVRPLYEYFESTKHDMTDFKLEEKNEHMMGTAKVSGVYWKHGDIANDYVTLVGKYEFEFVPEGDRYKIMRMRFIRESVDGNKKQMKSAETKISLDLNYETEILEIPSQNKKSMKAWLFLPKKAVHDVVIINGNIANIKEQGPYQYARLFAARGIAAMVFDFVNFGESDGNVRNLEDPGQKIEDYRGIVDYISHRKEFAGSRISLSGMGASAGYAVAEAVNDPRVDRLLLIAPWFQNPDIVQAQEENYLEKLKVAREANHRFQQDGVITYIPVASFADRNAVLTSNKPSEIDYYTNPDRGNLPQWRNRFATMGWISWLNFDSTSAASRVRVPTLIVHNGRNYQDGLREFTERMRMKPEAHELSAALYDFYDHADTMKQTVDLMEGFLNPSRADTGVTSL
jgi:dienelactone hydrolase